LRGTRHRRWNPLPYRQVYDDLFTLTHSYVEEHEDRISDKIAFGSASPRTGVFKAVYHPYILGLGWRWTPTMRIGSGCRVHLRPDELPPGRLIVQLANHLVAVIDGVIHDICDDPRAGTRCVYGYYAKP
jgi:hypothetical protein